MDLRNRIELAAELTQLHLISRRGRHRAERRTILTGLTTVAAVAVTIAVLLGAAWITVLP